MIITILGFSILLFVMWIVMADVQEYTDKSKYPAYIHMPALFYAIVFYIVDVVYNYTIGSLIFWQLPRRGNHTLTERLTWMLHNTGGWRWDLAYFICKYFISPWDYNHCGLGLGKNS